MDENKLGTGYIFGEIDRHVDIYKEQKCHRNGWF